MSRVANFCPACAAPLVWKNLNGRERPVCPDCGHTVYFDPKVAVLVWVVQDDKVLLVRRALDPGQGKWACPAGFMDYDEEPEDAAVRETLEETGLHVSIDRLIEVFPKRDDGLANLVLAYAATVTGGSLQADDDADAVGWFSRDALPELVFYPSITLANRWRSGDL